jgi:hypothetical protein
MPITKTTRFEIFKRDQFSCRYCGRTPPAVILEVDHVIAVTNGGQDDRENLVTSCFDCNRGKGARALGNVLTPLADSAKEMQEREEQLKAYSRLLRNMKRRREKQVDAVESIFRANYDKYMFSPSFRTQVRTTFLDRLPLEELIDAMDIACGRGLPRDRVLRYFCGIVWRKISAREAANA